MNHDETTKTVYNNSEVSVEYRYTDNMLILTDESDTITLTQETVIQIGEIAKNLANERISFIEEANTVLLECLIKPTMSYNYGLGLMLLNTIRRQNWLELRKMKVLDEDNWMDLYLTMEARIDEHERNHVDDGLEQCRYAEALKKKEELMHKYA